MTIDVERHGPVAMLTLDRPDTRNALSERFLGELVYQLQLLDCGCEIDCILIAGQERFFSAGADLDELLSREPIDIFLGRRAELWRAVREVRAPLVASLSGHCLGGGCELAFSCDMVVASPVAHFGQPETSLGLIPGGADHSGWSYWSAGRSRPTCSSRVDASPRARHIGWASLPDRATKSTGSTKPSRSRLRLPRDRTPGRSSPNRPSPRHSSCLWLEASPTSDPLIRRRSLRGTQARAWQPFADARKPIRFGPLSTPSDDATYTSQPNDRHRTERTRRGDAAET